MIGKALNSSLQAAKAAKEEEFYTQLAGIERELKHYKHHFKGNLHPLQQDVVNRCGQ